MSRSPRSCSRILTTCSWLILGLTIASCQSERSSGPGSDSVASPGSGSDSGSNYDSDYGPDPRDLEFMQVSDEIHVAFRPVPLRYWVEGNVTIILNEQDVVVVEGSGTDRSAEQVIGYIRTLTENPVSVLINTHGHGDHTVGNSVYRREFPGLEIIARPETRDYLTGSGIGYVKDLAQSTESRKARGHEEIARLEREQPPGYEAVVANLRQYYDRDIDIRQEAYSMAEIVPPTMTIDRRLVLHREHRTIDIR